MSPALKACSNWRWICSGSLAGMGPLLLGGCERVGVDDRLAGRVGGVEVDGGDDRPVMVAGGVVDDLADVPHAVRALDHQQLGRAGGRAVVERVVLVEVLAQRRL